MVISENGAGNLDTNDWFLDAKPGTPKTIPPSKVPKVISVAQSLSSTSVLNVDGSVNVKRSDQAKTLGLYVVGLVPPAFLDQVTTAPGALAKRAGMKADQPILANLTPSGWTVASGQLESLRSGVGSGLSGANSLLVNVNPATIPGARFCIGYGESASDMLTTGTINDFLSLPGATSVAQGLPCLLSGVYVDGPHTSPRGAVVPLRAVVVGQSPTGTVRFQERFADISPEIAITPVNAAVSEARVSYTPPATGEYAFGARYPGDGRNAAAASEVPLRHVVSEVATATTVRIDAPVSSEIGMEVRTTAIVSGNRPTGTVQFRRNGVNEGRPVPVIDDQAVISVVGLGLGDASFTAGYSGDAGNAPAESGVYMHKVLNVASSAVSLASSANPNPMGRPVTLTARVTGNNPTGMVTLREGPTVLASRVLANGVATFPLDGLSAGVHVFAADYSGDPNNPVATSNAVFEQVTLAGDPVRLTVTRAGGGSGTVSSVPSGINCPTVCSSDFLSGSTATLTATAAAGSAFTGWSGACSGTGACTVAIDGAKSVTASFTPSSTPASNYTALWWNPAESGWGVNFNHQGNILFATLFTYDSTGAPLWLVMSNGAMQADGVTFSGEIFRTTGPAFNANPFTPATPVSVGTMSVSFSGESSATLRYSFSGTTVTKTIQRQVFGTRAATCATTTASRASATNYQDLWWNASEPGWGVNVTHQDNTLFATLFTYDATGKGLWLVMSAGQRQADGSYLGDLFRTTGSAFNASPFTGATPTTVGTMRFRLTDGNNGTLTYTYINVPVSKAITRQVFSTPVPLCAG